jgi:hypothetical protein
MGFRVAYTVRDDVRVALEAALGVTVGLLVAGKVPDDQGLVATAREQHVGAIRNIQVRIYLSRAQSMPKVFQNKRFFILSAYDFLAIFSNIRYSLTSPER